MAGKVLLVGKAGWMDGRTVDAVGMPIGKSVGRSGVVKSVTVNFGFPSPFPGAGYAGLSFTRYHRELIG